ncbi:hypothetical protein Gotri_014296, partial [Gossypium trilobum]|nr:hypothetical protein [Gossypium trilobum]
MLKLDWRLIHEQDVLWAKVLASKYLLGNDQGREKRKISTIWASLKKVNGLRWAVGDGNSISYWDDDWCSTPISLELGMSDCLCWKHSKDGRLSLSNAYDLATKRKKLPVTGKEERWKSHSPREATIMDSALVSYFLFHSLPSSTFRSIDSPTLFFQ